jgi:hypothetical protein
MIGMLFLYILGYLILLGLPVGALLYVTRPQLAVWWESADCASRVSATRFC